MLKKLRSIADSEDRSVNKELLRLNKAHIAGYEEKHRELPLNEEKRAAKE